MAPGAKKGKKTAKKGKVISAKAKKKIKPSRAAQKTKNGGIGGKKPAPLKSKKNKAVLSKKSSKPGLKKAAKKPSRKIRSVAQSRSRKSVGTKNLHVLPLSDFDRALKIGRPPNVKKLFPNSKALLVSGKFIDRAMLRKGQSVAIATNARNHLIIRGVLQAAQRANAALIIEIARSEGGADGYCAVNYWNLARQVDAVCNELGISVPVAVHADHYGIKKAPDVEFAKVEIPTMFDAGITSIAIDASHMPDDECLLSNLELASLVPDWAGLETEVGEIKGVEGLSTVDEALFLIQGLNAHGIFPDWIALNNGTVHGIQESNHGIQVELTMAIHAALEPYHVSGAQHGTSGNSTERLREIVERTNTTKANVATALQMLSWGLEVNDYGNALLDEQGRFVKLQNQGVSEGLWTEMMEYVEKNGYRGGSIKKLNLPFEGRLLGQPVEIRERMAKRVEDFVYNLMVDVFNAKDTAPLAIDEILSAGTYQPPPKTTQIEKREAWTVDQIRARAATLIQTESPEGDYDD